MNFSRFRFRTLIMPITLALIFGALLLQSDHAWMKGADQAFKSSISKPSEKATPRKANSLSHAGYVAEAKASVSSAMAFTPLVSANKTVNLPTASPGNTLTYNVTITNSGTTATTGVLFSDTIDANTTLVPGSVNTSPLALTDSYACTGNVGISVPAASGVLINDFDPDGTIPAIVAVNTAGTQGTVSLNPGNGSFTFNPAPGFEGTTTFSYTLSDGVFSDIGTVSITVSGMIWFIDDSVAGPGDGRLSAPFNSVANFNSLAADDPGDNIFLYSGSYSSAITLLNNQKLIGQGATASLVSITGLTLATFGNALPATGGARPTITNSATVLTLGQGNLIRGFNVTNTAGTGISGSSFGNLTASEISVTASTCTAAVNLSTGNPNASFTAISASNCTNGIVLNSITGPFSVTGTGGAGSGGTIQNIVNGDGIVLNTTSALISLQSMIIQDVTATNDASDALQTHSGADAIHGRAVSGGLTLTNSTIQRISDNAINGTVDGVPITNNPTATTWSGLTITNCTFQNTNRFNVASRGDATNESAIIIWGVKGTVSVTGSTFQNCSSGIDFITDSTGTLDMTVQSNTFNTLYKEIGTNSVGRFGISVVQEGTLTSTVRVGDWQNETNAALGNTFTNAGNLVGIRVISNTTAMGNLKALIAKNTFTVTDHSSPGQPPLNTIYNFPQSGVLLRHVGNVAFPGGGNFESIVAANTFNECMHADGGLGNVSVIMEKGDAETIIRNNTFNKPWDLPMELRSDGQSNTQASSKIQVTGNTHIDGIVGDGTTDLGGQSPYGSTYVQVRNNGRMDLTMQNEATPLGLTDTGSATGTVSLFTQTTTAGDILNIFLQNIQGPRGYRLSHAAGSTYNLFRNGSAGGTAQLVLQDNNVRGGGGIDTTNPPTVTATGTITLTNTAPMLPSITPSFAPIPDAEIAPSGQTGNQAQVTGGGNSPGLFARAKQWLRPVFSAFSSPKSFIAPAKLFGSGTISTTVEAAEFTNAMATMSGETVNKAISVIPPGKTVQIRFLVTVDSPFPAGVCTVSNQGSVSGSGFTTFLTNAATTTILLAPTIGACPTNITTNTDPGLCTAAVTFTPPTATGCPMPTVTCSPVSGSAFPKGTTTVTCTATNGVSPNSTCSFTVTVNDNQGPSFAGCPTNINANTAAGLCTAPVTYTAPTATDVCDGARTVTCSPASGSSFAKGVTTVTCSASDTSGNSNSCSFTVTVADNQGPVLTACPTSISLNTAAGLCTAVATYTAPTANDVCDGARTVTCSPASGTAFAKGTTTVTCTTSDTSGNNSSCSFTVTVTDNQAPTVTCPAPISLTESPVGSGSATATFSATANDVCDGARTVTCSPASGSSFPVGVTTVNCSASDLSGNSGSCSFTVTVGIACTINCPTNIVTNTTAGQCGANVNYSTPTATGCGTVTCTPAANSFFPKGTTTVNCTTTAGPSCSFTVTVNDAQGPTLTACPSNIALNTAAGLCTAVATYTAPTANDACDGARTVTCSPASGTAFAKGVTTVTCSASDTLGNNSSCSFTVTVADNQAPTVSCPSPISLTESSPGSGSATATFSATANDVCDGARTVTCSPASGSSFTVGVTTVTCSASDTSGNSGSCSFTVTVASACTINCPSNITVNNNPGQCGANATYSTPTATGCGTVTCSPASGSFFVIGTTTVTCNTTAGPSCSFTVTVNDNQAPSVTCPANVNTVTNNTTGACAASGVSLGTATVVDNCGGSLTPTGTRSDSQPLSAPYPVGTTTITWSATDSSGNTGTCTQTVTVTNPDPVVSINGPASGSIFPVGTNINFTGSFTDNPGTYSATWMFDSITVAGTVNQTLKTASVSYAFTTPGVYSVSLTITDNCGGSGSANTIGTLDAFVVVYDPNGGFVTGGGWIHSPPGAYDPDPTLVGKATFGFVSKYKPGNNLPQGQTEFQFKAANLNFKSTVYEWLVVSGARAQFKGSGTINNVGDYRFILTAIDGQQNGGGGQDKFRIRIWDNSGGGLVYDNQLSAPDDATPTTVLGGGSIVIHRGGNGNNSSSQPTTLLRSSSDFDGDGLSDPAVFQTQSGRWMILDSSTNALRTVGGGFKIGDSLKEVAVSGDYDGDGKADTATFRRSNATWQIKRSSDGQTVVKAFGLGTDEPVPADYDGDGITDLAVWRGTAGYWYVQQSTDGALRSEFWGWSYAPYLDVPVLGDYDGDGKADFAVFRRSTGIWYIKYNSTGEILTKLWGYATDIPRAGDFDGDGKADIAVWRPSEGRWYIVQSSTGSYRMVQLGASGDVPMIGDYDGDGVTDPAIWNPGSGKWSFKLSRTGGVSTRSLGSAGDTPVPNK